MNVVSGRVAGSSMAKFALEVVHTEDTVDVSRIISEKDTTEGGEGAEEVSTLSDGRLEAVNPGGIVDLCGRHVCRVRL